MTTTTDTGFDSWMAKVDAHVQKRIWVSVHDLGDCCFMDWYEDGISPSRAASMAIRREQGYDE